MIATTIHTIISGILIIGILLGMILVLLGINRFLYGNNDMQKDEKDKFVHEVDEESDVISSSSVFHEFIMGNNSTKPLLKDKRKH